MSLTAALSVLNRFVDWFIPAELAANRETRKQARLFLISHLLGPFIGNVVPAALYVLDPMPGFNIVVLAAAITGFWVFPFVLRAFGHYNLLALLSIQNLIFCILWSCYWYGGITSPTLPWVLVIPLLAFFYLGSAPTLRLIVLVMFATNFGGFIYLQAAGYTVQNTMPTGALQGLGLVSTVAASGYVAMMALFYAKVLASQGELESEMRGHLATAAELRRATEEAEQANAAKSDFLAKMSHELRTPLNAVIGYSQILLEDAADEGDTDTISDLEKIHGAGQHLLKLVNEVLDLSKIEAGKMELFSETIALPALIDEVVGRYRSAATERGNTIAIGEVDVGPIVCDAGRLSQIVEQLVDNAVKFTEGGVITVEAKRQADIEGDRIALRIADTGVGIAADQLATLFERFSGVEDATATKYGGAGLGLALSQRLCRLMGGDIAVDSRPGAGTCFTVTLPAQPPASAFDLPPAHDLRTLSSGLPRPVLAGDGPRSQMAA
jgi:signal transduction histidine kinase